MIKKNENLNVAKSILAELHAMVREDYKDGGRLPSSREMCKKYSISPPTYGKAVRDLIAEGIAYKDSNKGIYIYPDGYICRRIGIVVDYAKNSPFLGHNKCLSSFLAETFNAGYNVQLIQANNPDAILTNANLYCVSALVFIQPEYPMFPYIQDISRNADFPVLSINTPDPYDKNFLSPPECLTVTRDYQAEGRHRLEIIQKYGFTSVAYAGALPWFVHYIKLPELAEKAGIQLYLERPLDSIPAIQTNLRGLVRKKKIQVIYAEGGLRIALAIEKELHKLKPEQRPALIFSDFLQFSCFAAHYRDLHILGSCGSKGELLGKYAAQMLMAHLKKETPLKSAELDTFEFHPFPFFRFDSFNPDQYTGYVQFFSRFAS